MASSPSLSIHLLLFLLLLLPLFSPSALSTTFTITNNCGYTVWPGILSGAGTSPLSTTGFSLPHGESRPLPMPSSWSGRLWGRTLCSADPSTAKFSCSTGDCGDLSCSGGASPPATLAEFTLAGSDGLDFFDVSLVDGYNLPILIVPKSGGGGAGKCGATGCAVDLNGICPSELRVLGGEEEEGKSVACRSACEAFGKPEFCCSGEYGSPNTCKPSEYSEFFKNACPRAYSYAYDDASSTFTCAMGTDYEITFCPSTTSQKAGENIPAVGGVPLINDTMVFMGVVQDTSSATAAHTWSRISTTFVIFWLVHLHHLFF